MFYLEFGDESVFWRQENVLETRECFGDERMFWIRENVLETRVCFGDERSFLLCTLNDI